MSIPAALNTVIENYSSSPNFEPPTSIERTDELAHLTIRVSLMHDDLGRVQVIYPSDCMFNVDQLNSSNGRDLKSIGQNDIEAILSRYAVSALPAIPDITGLPCIVDESIFELDSDMIYLDAGEQDSLIALNRNIFLETLGKAQKAKFTIPVSSIPWNQCDLDNDIEQINQAIEKFTSLRIKQRLADTLEIPPLPQSAQEIIALRAKVNVDSDELSSIVERDPSLSAQVVSWASSSFYNAPGKVKSVHDAIVRVLGFDLVMNLAMGLSLGKTLNLPKDEPAGYLPYWQNALWMALGTTALISKIDPKDRPSFGMAYLSGLLHNFGYLILAHVFPPHFSLICRYREANPHLDPSIIEHHLLGITSEQMGSQLMAVWGLPAPIISAIRQQKNPNYSEANCEYSQLLHLAHYFLEKKGIYPQTGTRLPVEIMENFGLDQDTAENALNLLMENQTEVDSMASMMSPK